MWLPSPATQKPRYIPERYHTIRCRHSIFTDFLSPAFNVRAMFYAIAIVDGIFAPVRSNSFLTKDVHAVIQSNVCFGLLLLNPL